MSCNEKVVDVVLPAYNEEEGIYSFYEVLVAELERYGGYKWRLVFVDDGSRDNTLINLLKIAAKDDRVVVASFSRNFGHQAALSAGIDLAGGDALIMMDTDLQHPPSLIGEFLEQWEQGADVVSAVRRSSIGESFFKRFTSAMFYRVINGLSDTRIVPGVADFGLLSRRAYVAIRQCPERHRFLRGMVSWIGFRRSFVEYECQVRKFGISKYSIPKMLNFALDGLLSFSTRPLRIFAVIGLLSIFVGAVYLCYAILRHILFDDLVDGWASVICTLLISTGFLTCLLVVVAEYVGRVFEQVKGRPVYILASRSDVVLK
jgi:dolichol-phosphate mannosyltransferase